MADDSETYEEYTDGLKVAIFLKKKKSILKSKYWMQK